MDTSHLTGRDPTRQTGHIARPAADEPGTLGQQHDAIGLYLGDPSRHHDRDDAWQRARALAIPHALRAWGAAG